MAARINLKHVPFTRDKIKARMLAKRLEDHGLGLIELSATQVSAINILLKKCVPDLSAAEITNVEAPVRYYAELPRKAQDVDAWAKDMADRVEPDSTTVVPDQPVDADQALTLDSTTKH